VQTVPVGDMLGVVENEEGQTRALPRPATTGHSIAVMRAVYSHPPPKDRRGGTDAIAAALSKAGVR
jgi:hypothetical protein